MDRPMCSKEGLSVEARPAGVRSKKLLTTAAAKGSIMGTRTYSAVEVVFRLERVTKPTTSVPVISWWLPSLCKAR